MLTTPLVTSTVTQQLKILTKLISPAKKLVLDLSELSDIDSSGIAMLLTLQEIAKQQKCNLTLSNLSPFTSRLCDLYKINLTH